MKFVIWIFLALAALPALAQDSKQPDKKPEVSCGGMSAGNQSERIFCEEFLPFFEGFLNSVAAPNSRYQNTLREAARGKFKALVSYQQKTPGVEIYMTPAVAGEDCLPIAFGGNNNPDQSAQDAFIFFKDWFYKKASAHKP